VSSNAFSNGTASSDFTSGAVSSSASSDVGRGFWIIEGIVRPGIGGKAYCKSGTQRCNACNFVEFLGQGWVGGTVDGPGTKNCPYRHILAHVLVPWRSIW
jgi:hypothetical protein